PTTDPAPRHTASPPLHDALPIWTGLVGVTKVSTTPDLKHAKVYLSVYAKTEEERSAAVETVRRSKNFIRNRLKDLVQIRLLPELDRKSTRLNSSHVSISYAVFCL